MADKISLDIWVRTSNLHLFDIRPKTYPTINICFKTYLRAWYMTKFMWQMTMILVVKLFLGLLREYTFQSQSASCIYVSVLICYCGGYHCVLYPSNEDNELPWLYPNRLLSSWPNSFVQIIVFSVSQSY